MKNRIMGIIYFICFAVLSGITLPTNAQEQYKIMAELTTNKYSDSNEIENLFRTNLKEFNNIVSYTKVPRGIVLSIENSIFFNKGSSEIKENSKEILDKIGQVIKFLNKPCVIEGNAKISSEENYLNWEISTNQSQKLVEYLIKNHNISPQKIRAIGFGSMMPSSLTERIDFVILNYDK